MSSSRAPRCLPDRFPRTGRETGIDVGLQVFLITAHGVAIENPLPLPTRREAARQGAAARAPAEEGQRRAAGKRCHLLASASERCSGNAPTSTTRPHWRCCASTTRSTSKTCRSPTWSRNHHLAKSIGDAGWAQFRTILDAKAACAGRRVIAVPPAYTSQDCSGCGARVPKSLSARTHICTSCGLVLDRDENAARNIQWAGQALRGVAAVAAGTNRESPVL